IAFCGVRFMAESARILARPDQIVIHPEEKAGCPMADMANLEQAEEAWRILSAMNPGRRIVPICYMNSNAEIKAFCGRHGGSVCTSSNAENILKWAWSEGDLVLFLPDEHLGRNTASKMGIDPDKVLVWNPKTTEAHSRDARYSEAKLVVWKGFCLVHVRFKPEQIQEVRAQHPDAKIIVHPECPIEVASIADAAASTEGIINYVKATKPGSKIFVGTEVNLVMRLAKQFPDREILPLYPSLCLNMAKVTLGHLLWVLEQPGSIGVVSVDPALIADSQAALKKMLETG
ncbi:TPA: quinolinate synthase NadA, partial [Candidatus Sumerlaeota bacterium]|nr:quinolinate synthase NadA [Candidatus Sumerlaeota bacterium]